MIIVISVLLFVAWYNVDFSMHKWFSIALVVVMVSAVLFGDLIHNRSQKQKMYYKNIIDSSSNIVVVVDENSIVEVNKTFFKYFNKYNTLEEFKKEHKSISDF
ncbi:MAG: hypothetical protein QG617_639, partial [Campylobacterota bacterium]|nr:hypothetical protein [Campylobacterota bacterium]